jgi:hypothetical protein
VLLFHLAAFIGGWIAACKSLCPCVYFIEHEDIMSLVSFMYKVIVAAHIEAAYE